MTKRALSLLLLAACAPSLDFDVVDRDASTTHEDASVSDAEIDARVHADADAHDDAASSTSSCAAPYLFALVQEAPWPAAPRVIRYSLADESACTDVVDVGALPGAVVADPDPRYLWIGTGEGLDTYVAKVDTERGVVVGRIDFPTDALEPRGLAVRDDGGRTAIIALDYDGKLWRAYEDGGAPVRFFGMPVIARAFGLQAHYANERTVLVSTAEDTIIDLDPFTERPVEPPTIQIGNSGAVYQAFSAIEVEGELRLTWAGRRATENGGMDGAFFWSSRVWQDVPIGPIRCEGKTCNFYDVVADPRQPEAFFAACDEGDADAELVAFSTDDRTCRVIADRDIGTIADVGIAMP